MFLDPLSSFGAAHALLLYGALFLGVFFEGELAMLVAGIMVHIGVLSFAPALGIILVAATLKTILGYRLGAYIGRRFPNSSILKYIERKVLYFLPRFKERPFWSIVVSKFIYGVNNATLVFAGYARANFRIYCIAEGITTVIWLGGMFMLGYFFSGTAMNISHTFRSFSLRIALFVIAFMIIQKIIGLIVEVFEEWGVEPK